MLRLTQHRKRKYISLGISVKEKDWDFKKNVPRKSCPDREAILKLISDKVSAYNSLIMELTAKQQEFTMSTLIQTLENRKKVQTVGQMYDYIINELRKSDKLGNMEVYKYSRDSYLNSTNLLTFRSVTSTANGWNDTRHGCMVLDARTRL